MAVKCGDIEECLEHRRENRAFNRRIGPDVRT
jgi:hypothetical protein